MRRKLLAMFLVIAFVLSQACVVEAKGFSRSFGGSKSFSKGWSSSSKSSGWGTSFKKSNGYTGSSSSRSVPGSYSTKASSAKSAASSTKKSSYMQDAFKKQTSSVNYSAYKSKLNSEQQKVYDDSMKTNFKTNRRMNFEDAAGTRAQRINSMNGRPVYINIRPGLFSGPFSWGMGYAGMWDLWFLMHASDLFWYHHWNELYPYRDKFDETKFNELEARVNQLEKENNGVRDPNYLDPNVDPDLQMSKDYQEQHVDSVYYTDKYSEPAANPAGTIIVIIIIGIGVFLIFRRFTGPKPARTYRSRIY